MNIIQIILFVMLFHQHFFTVTVTSTENVYRVCQPNGQWLADNITGTYMVNYDMCLRASEEIGPINALAGSADEPFALLKVVYAIYAHYCYSALSHPIQVPPDVIAYHLPLESSAHAVIP